MLNVLDYIQKFIPEQQNNENHTFKKIHQSALRYRFSPGVDNSGGLKHEKNHMYTTSIGRKQAVSLLLTAASSPDP